MRTLGTDRLPTRDLPQLDAQLALLTGARVHSTWALAAIVVLAAACGGGSERAAVARPQVVRVGTTEIDGYSGIGFRLEIRRLVITSQGA